MPSLRTASRRQLTLFIAVSGVLVAAVATVIVYMRRPGGLQQAVTSGPEYIVPEAPGR